MLNPLPLGKVKMRIISLNCTSDPLINPQLGDMSPYGSKCPLYREASHKFLLEFSSSKERWPLMWNLLVFFYHKKKTSVALCVSVFAKAAQQSQIQSIHEISSSLGHWLQDSSAPNLWSAWFWSPVVLLSIVPILFEVIIYKSYWDRNCNYVDMVSFGYFIWN